MRERKGFLNFLGVDSLLDHLTAFIEAKIEIYKIEFREEASGALSKLMVGLVLFCLGWFFIMFLSIAAGYYLGTLLENLFLGFLIISGFYLLLFVVIYLLRDTIGLREFFEKKLNRWLNIDK